MTRTPQTYVCIHGFEWGGNSYCPGLHYTDSGNPEHEAFGRRAEEAVAEGRFLRVEGKISSRGIGSLGAGLGGRAQVLKE